MAEKYDPRIVRVSIQVDDVLKVYEGLDIKSTGTKFANPLQNEANVAIANLTQADRDYFLTATSPYNKNRTPKLLILEAGRASIGTTVIYQGNISSVESSQPPDIVLTFKCKANQFLKGKVISTSQPSLATLQAISQQAADDNGMELNFQATDRNVSNYSFTGGALDQVGKIAAIGDVDCYCDDNQLVVKDQNVPLKGVMRVLDMDSGLVGTITPTEQGVKVTYMLDTQTKLGGALQLHSTLNPQYTGQYAIFKLGWNITSRDTPFYWIPEAVRVDESGNIVIPAGVKKKKPKSGKRR